MAHQIKPAWMALKQAINDHPEVIARAIESVNICKYQPSVATQIATPEKFGWIISFSGKIVLDPAEE